MPRETTLPAWAEGTFRPACPLCGGYMLPCTATATGVHPPKVTFTAWISAMLQIQRKAHHLTRAREARGLSSPEIQEPHNEAARRIESLRRRIDPETVPEAFRIAWSLTSAP